MIEKVLQYQAHRMNAVNCPFLNSHTVCKVIAQNALKLFPLEMELPFLCKEYSVK